MLLIGRDPSRTGPPEPRATVPDWAQADPRKIERALAQALRKPSGGWVAVAASRTITTVPRKIWVDGQEAVAWRGPKGPALGPDSCPHLGAELSNGRVDGAGRLICPWHALALSCDRKHGEWKPWTVYDDGVLTWVRLDRLLASGESPTERPFLPTRPSRFLDATIHMEAACAPEDVLANRLDPWHGAHFHPHSFANLRVLEEGDDHFTLRVVYRIGPLFGMEVDARFDCPDPRTIVMTVVSGEGVGSVIETHASPLSPGRTAIIETTLATSERASVISWLPRAGILRPLVAERARKLWVDDIQYCERRYALRQKKSLPIAQKTAGV